ncbi:hypothetical protein CDD83_2841 [Cordyceps sp. RAO-2017]|nr:hypothetical protein CDD83_2841 [Cordyceps sp. RAO-2017]
MGPISPQTSVCDDSQCSDESGWLDLEPDEEAVRFVSMFDSESFETLETMLSYCQQHHGFDLVATIHRLQLDFLGAAKLVNYIRCQVKRGQSVPETIHLGDISDDIYLKPVMDNDAVLFSLGDILHVADGSTDSSIETEDDLVIRNRQLEAEVSKLQSNFANYRLLVQENLTRCWSDEDNIVSKSTTTSSVVATKELTDTYFESYAAHDIHETMLKDHIRTDAYRDFIYENKQSFQGKVVLDIGCGTGILSMFCARAGAAQVFAVDKSDIIDKAIENVFNNGLSDIVKCLRGAIEEVVLPVSQVDIIVSEWMGYCLLYEAMLPSVIFARDKYLKAGGLLVPSSTTLWIAPVEAQDYASDHVTYWRDVYGFDMKAMQEGIYDEVRIHTIPGSSVCGSAFAFKTLDLYHIRTEDLAFMANWESKVNREADVVNGFLIWFDVFFAISRNETPPEPQVTAEEWKGRRRGAVAFTTGPRGTETHWKQGLLLTAPQTFPTGMGQTRGRSISGTVKFSVLERNSRALLIEGAWSLGDQVRIRQSWKLK